MLSFLVNSSPDELHYINVRAMLMCDDPIFGVLYIPSNKVCECCKFSYVLERRFLDHASQCIVMVVIFAALHRSIVPEGTNIS